MSSLWEVANGFADPATAVILAGEGYLEEYLIVETLGNSLFRVAESLAVAKLVPGDIVRAELDPTIDEDFEVVTSIVALAPAFQAELWLDSDSKASRIEFSQRHWRTARVEVVDQLVLVSTTDSSALGLVLADPAVKSFEIRRQPNERFGIWDVREWD